MCACGGGDGVVQLVVVWVCACGGGDGVVQLVVVWVFACGGGDGGLVDSAYSLKRCAKLKLSIEHVFNSKKVSITDINKFLQCISP